MTKFIDGSKRSEPKKEVRKTVFTHFVNCDKEISKNLLKANDYDNVEFLFHDIDYGDVFKAWDNHREESITLFFGTKGDEDYE